MQLENATDIAASSETVWAVTEDVERWPEWSPAMQSVRRLDAGPFRIGSAALIKQVGLPEARWVVTALTRGKSFTWETQLRGTLMRGTHVITPAGNGTRSLLRLEVFGFFAALLWPLMYLPIRSALAQENAGLKKRCTSAGT